MGDQETMLADWWDDSQMEECDASAPLTVQTSSARNPDYTHDDFVHKLKVQILPNDQEKCNIRFFWPYIHDIWPLDLVPSSPTLSLPFPGLDVAIW